MKNGLFVVSLLGLILSQAQSARADESPADPPKAVQPQPATDAPAGGTVAKVPFREPGRFGLMGAVTNDGFQFGGARVAEHYEIVLTADASFADLKASTGATGATGDLGTTLRGGPRFSLGQLNYFVAGLEGHVSWFGRDSGVSTMGQFAVGPYLGLERHFAGTPLMISLWVMPYQLAREVSNDGSGGRAVMLQHQFFQGGGFGLTYLL